MRAVNVIVEKNKVIKRQKNNSIVKDSERYQLLQHIMYNFRTPFYALHVLSELHIIYAYIVSNRCYQIYGITYFRIFFGFYFDFSSIV